MLPFCTISNSRHHNPEAIWTYLDPVLQWLEQNTPHDIRKLCVFSDGPATQYRQKNNLFAFCRLRDYLPDVNEAEWHFFEASHGKGAPDGIGGALKRAADRIVSHGHDLRSAKDVYDALKSKETNIKLSYVGASDVEGCLKRWEGINLPTVPGTMAMHQLTPKLDASLATLTYREVSCLCVTPTACQCAPPRVFPFPDIEIPANVRNVDINSTTTSEESLAQSAAMESEASAPVAEHPASACQWFRRISTNPDGRCFFRAIAIGKNQELQYADRNSDQLILDIRVRLREINTADALRSTMIMHIVDNFDLYKDIASWAASADLPLGKSYTSIEERVASSAKPTEMVGELEILAMSRTLRQQIHVVVGDSTLRYGEEFPRSNVLMVLYVSLAADVGHFDALVPPTRSSCTVTVTPARGSPFPKAAKPKGDARTTKSV